MKRATRVLALVTLLSAAACGGGGDGQRQTATDSVAMATAALSPATFDTVAWPTDSAAVARGAVVWTYSCRKCHGVDGSGDGGFVQAGDTIRPPSLIEPDWRFASDREAMRQHIFVGTEDGMPHWGIVGLKPRDIDAVSRYIQEMLRW